MDDITQARHNFVLAFQCCWNGTEFPVFRVSRVNEIERIHTGYCAIDLLDEALKLNPDFQEARDLRGDIWHAILKANRNDNYQMYLNSKAWAEIRGKCFDHFGRQCLFCSNPATQIHHRDYANIGKENVQTDLSVLCDDCHRNFHELKGKEYWDQFKSYVKENGDKLKLFPKPDLPSFYGIEIDGKTVKSADRHKDGAIWLVAHRSANKLQARLYVQSSAHYSVLKEQEETINGQINGQFDENLGVLRWEDENQRLVFWNDTVGHVEEANTDQEFPWLHNRLVRLHEVFQPIISQL